MWPASRKGVRRERKHKTQAAGYTEGGTKGHNRRTQRQKAAINLRRGLTAFHKGVAEKKAYFAVFSQLSERVWHSKSVEIRQKAR
ncbi:hypothetical protein M5D96_012600 [Drosophila gunungcola]|uniref:Uncharacterized protein n=1 Tax=Drosophila gunungcola TaxID=103775 RepID=A0A9P9YCV8_9MUSC|nr:hypothetical protein M5D96_012600 [Drosophila gunungcola]